MPNAKRHWDYLIVTASNEMQATAYEHQLKLRQSLGLLHDMGQVVVVSDPMGKRVGSGGSTIWCLMQVLNRQLESVQNDQIDRQAWLNMFGQLRILIIHAGGDSKRLPAYGPCGKLFVPTPRQDSDSVIPQTLFDRLLTCYQALPMPDEGEGQVVVASGDVVLDFDPTQVRFDANGVTALGCIATPESASKHGVFCIEHENQVRLFLQKPTEEQQTHYGAIDRFGNAVLDIGVMNFSPSASVALLDCLPTVIDKMGQVSWSDQTMAEVGKKGFDLYSDVCAALGSQATADHYQTVCTQLRSQWDSDQMQFFFDQLHSTVMSVQVLNQCGFLHFGTTSQLIDSGCELFHLNRGSAPAHRMLMINSQVTGHGSITGHDLWIEGCQVSDRLDLEGRNVVTGVVIDRPLKLPGGACLDLLAVKTGDGQAGHVVRCYGIDDQIKDTVSEGATFCNHPVLEWIDAVGATPTDIWGQESPPDHMTLWNAKIFPAINSRKAFVEWLWMFIPTKASEQQKKMWREAERYSFSELALLSDISQFWEHRHRIAAELVGYALKELSQVENTISDAELVWALQHAMHPEKLIDELLIEARWQRGDERSSSGMHIMIFSRLMHLLGSAIEQLTDDDRVLLNQLFPQLDELLSDTIKQWLDELGLPIVNNQSAKGFAAKLKHISVSQMSATILSASIKQVGHPKATLRPDETVWGRSPARLDLGGGWTDTPPYTLEYGGVVINTAINLNGQSPIHCYARITEEPIIRLHSIDTGTHVELTKLEQLLDYCNPTDNFGLVKAALAISGFSPTFADWQKGVTLPQIMEQFGGGLELTTLVGIPKGSGLGTSSIVGATILGTIQRVLGHDLERVELFHNVMRLEQALTTGGGWQDQIGGLVEKTKVTYTQPGMLPNPVIHFVPSDVIDPKLNGHSTLLYYTGLTRLAKNILEQVVGEYLNRNRSMMRTLERLRHSAEEVVGAMSQKDYRVFGEAIRDGFNLKREMCPDVSNRVIDDLLAVIDDDVWGATLAGAGSGGFMLMICKSSDHAKTVRQRLENNPLNDRSKFFDFDVSDEGLRVTYC